MQPDDKSKRIRSILGYLQENVPNVHPIDAEAPEKKLPGDDDEEDATQSPLGRIPAPRKKPRPADY